MSTSTLTLVFAAVAAVGSVMTIVEKVLALVDRRRKRKEDEPYEEWLDDLTTGLHGEEGAGDGIYAVPAEDYPFMVRALKEGRLVGAGFGAGTVMLPAANRCQS
jgi:hypothetical protein